MERRLSASSRRSAPSPIQELSHLAQRVGAINLAEGFPDFPAPAHVKAAATAAIAADLNQYSPHNPTGKVFNKEELLIIAQACQKMDCFAVTDEIEFVLKLIKDAGVAAVPGRGFFHGSRDFETYHHQYVRFAFCKGDDTLKAAALKMRNLVDNKGRVWLNGRQEDLTAFTP
ncbi:hypothetical protein PR202_gb08331 [Eleusine coracana subsp. coracana]|uniref:Aminotransferase class I/classII large domain-containing protein n=1 Tax=Eleusine coracana subsp. coracana TaxID=191504 RepID=A0AAV5EDM8_ELECO|nr:hypothetical protein PR202_gb08331 [Eleusine coracana subsp. coracana]